MLFFAAINQTVGNVPVGLNGGAELAAAAIGFALLPAALALCTCFPRIYVTLSILRQGLGLGAVPSNLIVLGLSVALTVVAMTPTLKAAWDGGLKQLASGNNADPMIAVKGAEAPLRAFMFDQGCVESQRDSCRSGAVAHAPRGGHVHIGSCIRAE